jgi:hypothetical protein
MLPGRKTPRPVLKMSSASRNTGALCLASSDTGRTATELALEPRRLPRLRTVCRNRTGQRHQGMVLRQGHTRLLLMLGRRSARGLSIRRRTLLRAGIISHGRVSDCSRISFWLRHCANNLQCVLSILNIELYRFTNHHCRMIQHRFGEPGPIQPHHRLNKHPKTAQQTHHRPCPAPPWHRPGSAIRL